MYISFRTFQISQLWTIRQIEVKRKNLSPYRASHSDIYYDLPNTQNPPFLPPLHSPAPPSNPATRPATLPKQAKKCRNPIRAAQRKPPRRARTHHHNRAPACRVASELINQPHRISINPGRNDVSPAFVPGDWFRLRWPCDRSDLDRAWMAGWRVHVC